MPHAYMCHVCDTEAGTDFMADRAERSSQQAVTADRALCREGGGGFFVFVPLSFLSFWRFVFARIYDMMRGISVPHSPPSLRHVYRNLGGDACGTAPRARESASVCFLSFCLGRFCEPMMDAVGWLSRFCVLRCAVCVWLSAGTIGKPHHKNASMYNAGIVSFSFLLDVRVAVSEITEKCTPNHVMNVHLQLLL